MRDRGAGSTASLEREVRGLRTELADLEREIAAHRRGPLLAAGGLAGGFVGVVGVFLVCGAAAGALFWVGRAVVSFFSIDWGAVR